MKIKYRPAKESVIAIAESIMEAGLIKKKWYSNLISTFLIKKYIKN